MAIGFRPRCSQPGSLKTSASQWIRTRPLKYYREQGVSFYVLSSSNTYGDQPHFFD
jgi:hypothetical protein